MLLYMSTNRQRRAEKAQALAASLGLSKTKQSGPKSKQDWAGIYRRKRELGECSHCHQPATVGTLCIEHWFKNVASNHFGTCTFAVGLVEIWDRQQGRCFYSGEILVPGVNAGLDHKVALTRGGNLSLENCQWVTKLVNRMKSDLTHDEFILWCRFIANRFPV